jgi:hypothetical protein
MFLIWVLPLSEALKCQQNLDWSFEMTPAKVLYYLHYP